ncbi:GAF domain-containing protein [Arthrobacter sp. MDT1-48-3]
MTTTPPPPPEFKAIFGRANGQLLTEQTAQDAVDGLADIARDIISAAGGAGVSIIDTLGTRLSVGATDPHVLAADDLQYGLGEGPCMSAWSTGISVYIKDTHPDDRFPAWKGAAAGIGIRSCLSVPLLAKPVSLSAMKVYADTVNASPTRTGDCS